MAPEIFSRNYGPAVDIFSLGITLFNLYFDEVFYEAVFCRKFPKKDGKQQFQKFFGEENLQEKINYRLRFLLLVLRGFYDVSLINKMQSQISQNKASAYSPMTNLDVLKNNFDNLNDRIFILLALLQVISLLACLRL